MDAYFDDEPGYRVRADEFALPEISLESDEASVVALATKVWEHARLAEATTDAVSKLSAAGLALDLGALDIAQPRLSADEPAFDVFWEATVARRAGHLRLPAPRVRRTAHPPPPAVGRRPLLGPLVRRRPRHRPRRGAGLPALPRRRPGQGGRQPGRLRDPTRHRRPRGRPPARTDRAVRGGRRPGPSRRRGRPPARGRPHRARRRRPRRRDAVGPAPSCPAAPRPTSCSPSAPTCTSSSRRPCATRSSRGCAPPPERWHDRRRRRARPATRSVGCSGWCPTSTAGSRCRSTRQRA